MHPRSSHARHPRPQRRRPRPPLRHDRCDQCRPRVGALPDLLHAIAACLSGTIVYHAAARGIALDGLECRVQGDVDLRGFLGLDPEVRPGFERIQVTITATGDFSDDQFAELVGLASFSPVRDSVANPVDVVVDVVRA